MYIDGLALARLEQQAVSIGFSNRGDYNFEARRVLSAGDRKGYSYVTAVFHEEEHAKQWVAWARENLGSMGADGVHTEVLRVCTDNPVTEAEAHVAVVCAYDLILKGGPHEDSEDATVEDVVVELTRLHDQGKLQWGEAEPNIKTTVDGYSFIIGPHLRVRVVRYDGADKHVG